MPCGWRRQTWRRFRGPGVYPHQLAWVLTVPLRRLVQPPQRLVARLGLPPMSRVLELGPGPGYFSAALARAVPGGGVVLCDAQRQMLAKARSRLNVGLAPTAWFVQGDAASLPFETAFFDAAVLVAVLGEVLQPAACLQSLHRVLRPSGLLSVTEMRVDPDALSLAEVRRLMDSSGFELAEVFEHRLSFTANFRRGQ